MTIVRFNCPNCDAPIALDCKNAGQHTHCPTCQQLFITPPEDEDDNTPEPESEAPLPGFYKAVFIDSWKIFFNSKNILPLTFVTAIVCLKFFLGASMCCVSFTSFVVVWGLLLGFYLNIIYETACDADELPEISLGTGITFAWDFIKPFLIFFFTMAVVEFPFIVTLALLKNTSFTYENMWTLGWLPLLLQSLFITGLFFFPAAILTIALGRDITLLRPDYIFSAVFSAFIPYLLVVTLLVAACFLETQTAPFENTLPWPTNAARLAMDLALQVAAIITMRSIGLFYRHYYTNFNW